MEDDEVEEGEYNVPTEVVTPVDPTNSGAPPRNRAFPSAPAQHVPILSNPVDSGSLAARLQGLASEAGPSGARADTDDEDDDLEEVSIPQPLPHPQASSPPPRPPRSPLRPRTPPPPTSGPEIPPQSSDASPLAPQFPQPQLLPTSQPASLEPCAPVTPARIAQELDPRPQSQVAFSPTATTPVAIEQFTSAPTLTAFSSQWYPEISAVHPSLAYESARPVFAHSTPFVIHHSNLPSTSAPGFQSEFCQPVHNISTQVPYMTQASFNSVCTCLSSFVDTNYRQCLITRFPHLFSNHFSLRFHP